MTSSPFSASLLDDFSALSDSRQSRRAVYPPLLISLHALSATLNGVEEFVEVRLWRNKGIDFLRRFLR